MFRGINQFQNIYSLKKYIDQLKIHNIFFATCSLNIIEILIFEKYCIYFHYKQCQIVINVLSY